MNPFELLGSISHIVQKIQEIDPEDIKAQVASVVENIAKMEASQRRTEQMVRAMYEAQAGSIGMMGPNRGDGVVSRSAAE